MNRKYNQEHIDFIKANIKGCPFKELTDMFNRRFGMNLRVSTMISLCARNGLHNERDTTMDKGYEPTQFKKGHVPWNKGMKGLSYEGAKATQFKKGHKPGNWVPIGTERINKDGYVEIKVADGQKQNNWLGKHVYIWEEHNGPLPKGHAVIFGDGGKRNFDLDNLVLVTRAQLVRMNQRGLIQDHAELTKTGAIIAEVYNKIGERKKKGGAKK